MFTPPGLYTPPPETWPQEQSFEETAIVYGPGLHFAYKTISPAAMSLLKSQEFVHASSLYQPSNVWSFQDGAGSCSAVTRDEASNLPAGTYRLRVRPFSTTATFNYVLSIDIR